MVSVQEEFHCPDYADYADDETTCFNDTSISIYNQSIKKFLIIMPVKNKTYYHPKRFFIPLVLILLFLPRLLWCQQDMDYLAASGFSIAKVGTTVNLYDLGVSDINNDGFYDIFATNHSYTGALLLNEEGGGFSENALAKLGINQSRDYPGLESDIKPPQAGSGLFIYYMNDALEIRAHGFNGNIQAIGQVQLPWVAGVDRNGSVKVETNVSRSVKGADITTIDFGFENNGMIRIHALPKPTLGMPVSIRLNHRIPLENVYIGQQMLNPEDHNISFSLQDRHGMAWIDIDLDGDTDVYVSRGGLHGRMAQVWPEAKDELFISNGTYFHNAIGEYDLHKDGCPGRQVAWMDFNNDGLPDLYYVCGRNKKTSIKTPNQLYKQVPGGTFENVSAYTGLDIDSNGTFIWLDADNDYDQDLIWSDKNNYWLYVNDAGRFRARKIGKAKSGGKHAIKLAAADFDNDGYIDVFAASKTGSAVLRNNGGSYLYMDPGEFGLPAGALTASWVDYDNDGLIDIHLPPHGLFRQLDNGEFIAANKGKNNKSRINKVRAAWADIDNDGKPDLIYATSNKSEKGDKSKPAEKIWNIFYLRNIAETGHWLQLDFPARKGRKLFVGARVEIDAGGKTRIAQVGHSDGSHYSLGSYRVYFGLGELESIDQLRIYWPDGEVKKMRNIKADQILEL